MRLMTDGAGSSMFTTTRAMQVMILRMSQNRLLNTASVAAAFLLLTVRLLPIMVRDDGRERHVPDRL